MAAFVTPCFFAYKIRACLKRIVCVIVFIANMVTCLSVLYGQLYLNTGSLYSLLFFIFCHTSLTIQQIDIIFFTHFLEIQDCL